MRWTIEFDRRALRDLQQLDRSAQRRILDYLEQRVAQPLGHTHSVKL